MSKSNTILVLVSLFCVPQSWASEKASPPACSYGICAINIFADDLMASPCSGYSGLITYSQSSGATLIQCSAPMKESKIFVFNRLDKQAPSYLVVDGHSLRPEYLLQQLSGAAFDGEASIPVCDITNQKKTTGLLIGQKEPSKSEIAPYCYRIYYVEQWGSKLEVTRDDGHKLSPATKQATAKWATLRRKLMSLVKP